MYILYTFGIGPRGFVVLIPGSRYIHSIILCIKVMIMEEGLILHVCFKAIVIYICILDSPGTLIGLETYGYYSSNSTMPATTRGWVSCTAAIVDVYTDMKYKNNRRQLSGKQ